MNKTIVIMSLLFLGCSNPEQREKVENGNENHNQDTIAGLQLNNGSKWKTDEATRKNIAAIQQVVNDSAYAEGKNAAELARQLQVRIDTLVQQCRMEGADHTALHIWLEKVLYDIKELKTGKEQEEVYAGLKKDINNFDDYFQ